MRPDIQKSIKKIGTEGWKKVMVEYGREYIEILVPRDCAEITMENVPIVADPKSEVERVISNPIQSPTLEEIVRSKNKPPEQVTVAITVSDITQTCSLQGGRGNSSSHLEEARVRRCPETEHQDHCRERDPPAEHEGREGRNVRGVRGPGLPDPRP